jgi:RimJ/RimL family protein N-acetyltransferase
MQLMDSDIHDLITAMHSKQIRLGLAELTPANYQQAVKLCLTPKQIQHVGTVEEAIAEAYFQRSYRLLVITPQSDNNYVIGFIMYDPVSPLTAPLNNVAIHKFLIGCDYQGRGYGEEAMRLFINKARFVNPRATIVELRTDTDNAAAIKVYKKVGFLMEPGDEPGVLAGIYLLK